MAILTLIVLSILIIYSINYAKAKKASLIDKFTRKASIVIWVFIGGFYLIAIITVVVLKTGTTERPA